jgi:PAS domain S-box-containing protein
VIISWNAGAERVYGYPADEAIGHNIAMLAPPGYEGDVREILRKIRAGQRVDHHETVRMRKNGDLVDVSLTVSPIEGADGKIVGASAIARDITEHQRTHEVQSLLASIVQSSDDGIYGEDLDGVITSWNAGAQRIYGYSPEEAIGRPVQMLVPPGDADDVAEYLERIKAGDRVDHYETVRMRRNGERIDVSLTVSPIEDAAGRIIGASAIARDITQRKRMEENLRYYVEEITKSQENERMRIARELHDDTIQDLIVLARDLDEIALGARGLTVEERQSLDEMRERINAVAEGIRRLSQDLRPDTLDRLGLLPALDSLASRIAERSGVAILVESRGVGRRIGRRAELLLFRFVQEALSNVERHAEATNADVTVEFLETGTRVTIKDDGKGFSVPPGMGDLARHGKLGLAGMLERARLLGGTASVTSKPGEGTLVVIEAPA